MSWLDDEGGLKFKCTQCGECCKSENGIVLVDLQERVNIARRLGMRLNDFEQQCTWSYDEDIRTLKTTSQGCIMFDPYKKICTIYGDHPRQCKTFPFWVGNIRTQKAWESIGKKCEGCNQGNFYPADRVKLLAAHTMRRDQFEQ